MGFNFVIFYSRNTIEMMIKMILSERKVILSFSQFTYKRSDFLKNDLHFFRCMIYIFVDAVHTYKLYQAIFHPESSY